MLWFLVGAVTAQGHLLTSDSIFFKASGSGNVSLSCNETKYQNANWTSGQIYSTDIVECTKANLTIKPSEISAIS